MKKTLSLVSILLLSVASSQAATLLAEWYNFADQTGGTLAATTGSLSMNLKTASSTAGGVLQVRGGGAAANRPTVNLSGSGLTLGGGVTISMYVSGVAETGNVNIFGLQSAENAHLFATERHNQDNFAYFAYNGSINNGNNSAGANTTLDIAGTNSAVITVTTIWNAAQNRLDFTCYENGVAVRTGFTTDSAGAAQALTLLALGGWAGTSPNSATNEDITRFAIHDGAMSASEVMALYNNWTNIPEPATATLGLLGLAGLMIRRRK